MLYALLAGFEVNSCPRVCQHIGVFQPDLRNYGCYEHWQTPHIPSRYPSSVLMIIHTHTTIRATLYYIAASWVDLNLQISPQMCIVTC